MSSEGKYLNPEYKNFFEKKLSEIDPEISKAIDDELIRQQNHIELIASENIVSQAVLEAQGSVLTNKYAEGYPGKRYYNGCEHVDVAESLAIDRLKKLLLIRSKNNNTKLSSLIKKVKNDIPSGYLVKPKEFANPDHQAEPEMDMKPS